MLACLSNVVLNVYGHLNKLTRNHQHRLEKTIQPQDTEVLV